MADGVQPKSRQPSKLKKTPLQLVISSDPSASSQQGPIGTPPPISLRKCRLEEPTSADHQGVVGSSSSSSLFPQISVDKCPEETGGDDNEFSYPATGGGASDDGHRQPVTSTDDGLTPPQRLLTRDGDGIVFELSHGLQRHVAGGGEDKEVTGHDDGI